MTDRSIDCRTAIRIERLLIGFAVVEAGFWGLWLYGFGTAWRDPFGDSGLDEARVIFQITTVIGVLAMAIATWALFSIVPTSSLKSLWLVGSLIIAMGLTLLATLLAMLGGFY